MNKKVIISEEQLSLLSNHIFENNYYQIKVKQIVDELDLNYKPSKGTYKKGGEYFEKPMVVNKVNKELQSLKSLYNYISYKFKLNDNFIKQVISDWFTGDISDTYTLSKNITID